MAQEVMSSPLQGSLATAATALASGVSRATGSVLVVPTSTTSPDGSRPTSFSWFVFTVIRGLPGILYWVITFLSITLPTWLFTLASTSLTFTLNATTL